MDIKQAKSIADLAAFCKRTGLIFPNSDIYGGLSGFYDYGPRGVEIKNNIKNNWWKKFVLNREDVVGIDGTIITSPKVWKASGHIDEFSDISIKCKKCKKANRIEKNELGKAKCEFCRGQLDKKTAKELKLMFKTQVGPVETEKTASYLRPETAQTIFTNFKTVQDVTRLKLPFGIAQTGKAFRNEISPRDFLFRMREFEMMEIEFFVNPKQVGYCPYFRSVQSKKINFLSAKDEKKGKRARTIALKYAVDKKLIKNKWLAYWLWQQYEWFLHLGIKNKNLRVREHAKEELAHYASACYDIEYSFPFGWREIYGIADRGQFDLKQHMKFSKKDLTYFDGDSKKRIIPYVVAEPSQGIDRAFLAFILDAYKIDKNRIVLKLHPDLAPYKVAIFPLLNRDKLPEKAKEVFKLLKKCCPTYFEVSGNIGKSYRRMDEIGTPFCITVDHQTLKDSTVTVRDRDTMKQNRVKIKNLTTRIFEQLGCC